MTGAEVTPSAKETPVEAKMRKVLVNTAVRHALRCVQVRGEDRAALVVQRYWRSYAAARELRRRRWAARRKRWSEAGVAAVLAAPFNVVRAVVRAVSLAVWTFLMTFWLVRTIVWFVTSIPLALFHALVSWEAVAGAAAATALAARGGRPGMGFQDYFAVYVVGFVLLDIGARDMVVRPVVAAGAAGRRGVAAVARFTLMTAARLSPTRAGETACHRLAKLLGLIEKMPQRYRVLHFATPPPLVMPAKKKSQDPELLDALRTAELFARESKTAAEQLEEKLGEMEEKLRTFTTLSEAQMSAAREISERASTAVDSVMEQAAALSAHRPEPAPRPGGVIPEMMNTSLVDERIDKRFEDMEAMLRAARDEGRAEGVREGAEWHAGDDARNVGRDSFDRMPRPIADQDVDNLTEARPETIAAIERGLKEGMARGIVKGIELEKMRKKQKGWKPVILRMFGMESKKGSDGFTKKQAAKIRLEELKTAIRNNEIVPPKSNSFTSTVP